MKKLRLGEGRGASHSCSQADVGPCSAARDTKPARRGQRDGQTFARLASTVEPARPPARPAHLLLLSLQTAGAALPVQVCIIY